MRQEEFKLALEEALKLFPGITLKNEQELCLKTLIIEKKDVLGVFPTGYGKSIIYQLLPKVLGSYWLQKTGEVKTAKIIVVSPLELLRKQQTERLCKRGIKAATLENMNKMSDESIEELEIVFGSAELWLSTKWSLAIKSGSLKAAKYLVIYLTYTTFL